MDLYNDSAHYALTKFKKQFLYDEIEAEVKQLYLLEKNSLYLNVKMMLKAKTYYKRFRTVGDNKQAEKKDQKMGNWLGTML